MGLLRNMKTLVDLVRAPQRTLEEIGHKRHLEALRSSPHMAPPPNAPREIHYMRLEVEESACTGCGACITMCPVDAIQVPETIAKVDQDQCVACGACIPGCPEGALDITEG